MERQVLLNTFQRYLIYEQDPSTFLTSDKAMCAAGHQQGIGRHREYIKVAVHAHGDSEPTPTTALKHGVIMLFQTNLKRAIARRDSTNRIRLVKLA